MNQERLGIKQLADRMCCSQQAIYNRIEQGLPRQDDGKFSWRAVWHWHNERLAAKSIAAQHDPAAYAEAELRKLQADTRRSEIRTKILENKFVDIADVERAQVRAYTVIRSRLLAVPNKLTPQLIGESDRGKISTLLRDEIYQALTELSQTAAEVE